MVARYKKKTHNSGQIFSLIGLVSVIVIVFAAIGMYLINYVFFKQDIDYTKNKEGTLCPLINNKPLPDGHAVILIDVTDKLDKIQKRSILNEMDRIVENMKIGQMLSLYILSAENLNQPMPVFEKCKIQDGKDASVITENPKLIYKKYKETFYDPLIKNVKNVDKIQEDAKSSPIVETLQKISAESFNKWQLDPNGSEDKILYIFSDMLQNTKKLSMFKKSIKYEEFAKSSYASQLSVDLDNVDVEIYRFNNRPDRQTNENSIFWKNFISDRGGHLVLVKNLGAEASGE